MTAETDAHKALALLQVFASVGVKAWDVTLTDLDGKKLPKGYSRDRSMHQLRYLIGPMVRDATAHQHNVIVRPHPSDRAQLVQLDDLAEPELRRLLPVSLVVLQTSLGNAQAWVAVEDPAPDFARRLRQGTRADPSASGATRISGSRNFKVKYAPHFPTVEITACHPGQIVPWAELESRGLVAPAAAGNLATSGCSRILAQPKIWPSYQRCMQYARPVHGGENRPDISQVDFCWSMAAIDWGWSVAATAARLMKQSRKAQENGERYAWLTAQNAAAVVTKRRAKALPPPPRASGFGFVG